MAVMVLWCNRLVQVVCQDVAEIYMTVGGGEHPDSRGARPAHLYDSRRSTPFLSTSTVRTSTRSERKAWLSYRWLA